VPGDHGGGSFADSPAAELVVHAELEDVVADPGVDRGGSRKREAGVEEGVGAEVDVEEFALYRPAVAERVFGANADSPTPDVLGCRNGRVERVAALPLGLLHPRPGAAAGHVPEPLVGHSITQAGARRAKPGL